MIGTIVNVAGIVVGGAFGLRSNQALSPAREGFFKVMLGAFTTFYGLRLTWINLSGPAPQMLKQLVLAVVALIIGKLLGQLLRLQDWSNRIGRKATATISHVSSGGRPAGADGFKVCAALFCAAPLGIVGAVEDGLAAYYYPLAVKGVMDGLAAMSFVSIFGRSVFVAALPVLALQGSLTLLCQTVKLHTPEPVLQMVGATSGLMVFAVALVILQLKKVPLAEYLPSLGVAAALGWLAR